MQARPPRMMQKRPILRAMNPCSACHRNPFPMAVTQAPLLRANPFPMVVTQAPLLRATSSSLMAQPQIQQSTRSPGGYYQLSSAGFGLGVQTQGPCAVYVNGEIRLMTWKAGFGPSYSTAAVTVIERNGAIWYVSTPPSALFPNGFNGWVKRCPEYDTASQGQQPTLLGLAR